MAASQLDGAIKSAVAALADWNHFLGDLATFSGPNEATKFDLSAPIPTLVPPVTVQELNQKLSGTVALVQGFSEIETTVLIPDNIVTGLVASVAAVRATVEKLLAQITALEPESKITALNPEAFAATNEKGQQFNVGPGLAELYPFVQGLLLTAYQLRGMAGLSGKGGLALELTQMQASRAAQRQALADFKRLTRAVTGQRRELEAIAATAAAAAERIKGIEAKAATDIAQVTESHRKAGELIAAATATEQSAKTLKEVVETYSKSFATFQKDLDARNTDFEKGKIALETLLKESGDRRDALLEELTNTHSTLIDAINTDKAEIQRLSQAKGMAMGIARTAAMNAAKERRTVISVMVENDQGKFEKQWTFAPPAKGHA